MKIMHLDENQVDTPFRFELVCWWLLPYVDALPLIVYIFARAITAIQADLDSFTLVLRKFITTVLTSPLLGKTWKNW